MKDLSHVYATFPKRIRGLYALAAESEPDAAEAIVAAADAFYDTVATLKASRTMLIDLRDKHLNHTAAITRALVQHQIESIDRAILKTNGGR